MIRSLYLLRQFASHLGKNIVMKTQFWAATAALSAMLAAVPPAAFADQDWTGFKVGVGVAGEQTRADAEVSGDHAAVYVSNMVWEASYGSVTGQNSAKKNSISIGADAGYDKQFGTSIVAGVVGSLDLTSGNKATASISSTPGDNYGVGCDGANIVYDGSCVISLSTDGQSTITSSFSIGKTFSLGARLGFLSGQNTLFYVSGGWSGAQVAARDTYVTSATVPTLTGPPIPFNGSATFSQSKFQKGSFWGGGIEKKIGSNYSVKLEYRQTNYGKISGDWTEELQIPGHFGTMTTASQYGAPLVVQRKADLIQRALRLGVGYQF